jgi:hypothetical protein
MTNIRKFDIDPADSDPNGIAEDQQPDDGTPVVLNGAMCDLGTAGQFNVGDAYGSGIGGVQLTFESAASWAAVTFTIVGKDANGNAQTVTHTGPTTNNTTATFWSEILAGGITCDGTVGTNIEIGPSDVMVTKTIVLNTRSDYGATAALSGVSGTLSVDIEQTFDDYYDNPTVTTALIDVGWSIGTAAASTNVATTLTPHATACRLKLASYTNSAEIQFHVLENQWDN